MLSSRSASGSDDGRQRPTPRLSLASSTRCSHDQSERAPKLRKSRLRKPARCWRAALRVCASRVTRSNYLDASRVN